MKKKRILSILLTLVQVLGLMLGMSMAAYADGTPTYSGGTGTETDPWLISTVDDWIMLADTVNDGTNYSGKYFRQTVNLNMNEVSNLAPVGTLDNPFAGNYEGDGFAISNAQINCVISNGTVVAGIFGVLTGEGNISNLRVANVTVTATTGGGGWDQAYAGGLVALAENCTVTDCSVSGSNITAVGSDTFAGAIVGFAGAENSEKTVFSKCASKNNTVNTTGYGGGFIGTIVNEASDDSTKFKDCYSANNTADAGTHMYGTVGAFLGGSQDGNATVQNCFVYNCNATATGTGAKKGLFTGDTKYGTVNSTNCYYYDTQNLPVNAESATPKTADEMKSLAVTLGDAFTQGSDYPILLHPVNMEVSIDGWAYGENANEPSVTRNSSSSQVIYTYAVKDTTEFSETVPTAIGNYTVKVTVAATSTHKAGEATADFAITKAKANVITAPEAKTLTYNGQVLELVNAGSTNDGVLYYAVTTENTAPTDDNLYTTSIPTATDAGTYYVWYKVVGDDNHTDTDAKCIEVTIDPADSSREVTKKALPYTGDSQQLVTPGAVEGGTLEYALGTDDATPPTEGWSANVPTGKDPGTYYVWYRVVGDANHKDIDPACIVVTIAEPEPEEPTPETPAEVAPVPAEPAQPQSDYTLLMSMKASGKSALKLAWTRVPDAEGYDIFFGRCGQGACAYKATVYGTSYKVKGLKEGKAYKAYVMAWKTVNGNKAYIGDPSPDAHAIVRGSNKKYCNPKKISVKKKSMTLSVGKGATVKASVKKKISGKKLLGHTPKVRYYSSNRNVATVDAKGKVTAVAAGTCTVYALSENGLRAGVKVTVK